MTYQQGVINTVDERHRMYHSTREGKIWGKWNLIDHATTPLDAQALNISCANQNNALHIVCVTRSAGATGLWHIMRRPDTTWTVWGNVEEQAGRLGGLDGVACAGIGNFLHVLALEGQRLPTRLYHTVRNSGDGAWIPWNNVEHHTGRTGTIDRVICAAVGAELQVVVRVNGNQILHTIRKADGSWWPWGTVGAIDRIGGMACTGVGSSFYLFVETATRTAEKVEYRIYYQVRDAAGNWLSDWDMLPDPTSHLTAFEPSGGISCTSVFVKETETDIALVCTTDQTRHSRQPPYYAAEYGIVLRPDENERWKYMNTDDIFTVPQLICVAGGFE